MSWILLVLAGLLEVSWAVGLKYTDGFRRPIPSLIVGAAIAGSLLLLSMAVRNLPIVTAYAVWVGIGAFGATVCGILLFNETVTLARALFSPSSHATGRTVPYQGGSQSPLLSQHSPPVHH